MENEEKLTHAQEMIYAHFWSSAGRKFYDIVYAKILNNIPAAILITYLRDYQVEMGIEPDEVIIKTNEEIYKETGLSEKELKEARRKLKEKNWLEIKKINDQTYAYTLNVEQFVDDLEEYFEKRR